MKKVYSILTKALILSLVMALSFTSYAQEDTGDKKAEKSYVQKKSRGEGRSRRRHNKQRQK